MAELEGFICPLCRQDLKGFRQLEAHFREDHDESTRSKLKTNIKSFFEKARTLGKRRSDQVDEGAAAVSSKEGDRETGAGHVTNVSGTDPEYWPPQELGVFRDSMVAFKRIRDARILDTVVETNRLVIRMEKLFQMMKEGNPRTSKQMKVVERGVVPWKPDEEEKRCMKCGRSFGIRRRRHHCRLCGDVICKTCSQFISFSRAYAVLSDSPAYRSLAPSPSLRRKRLSRRQSKTARKKKGAERHREEEEEEEEDSDEIRMCPACEKLIQRRLSNLQLQEKPMLCALYEKMHLTMAEAERAKPLFLEMAESLLSGEHCYTLQATNGRRKELVRLYEMVDSISKDILNMVADEGPDPSPRVVKLYRGIRVYASNYLQENLLVLPALPTPEKLREIREAKEKEAWERIRELERQREALRQQEAAQLGAGVAGNKELEAGEEGEGGEKRRLFGLSVKMPNISFKKDGKDGGVVGIDIPKPKRSFSGSGWMGNSMAVGSADSSEDPFVLQKQQLQCFIQQARRANRMDEVQALEASLRDIESSMREQQMSTMSYGFTPDQAFT